MSERVESCMLVLHLRESESGFSDNEVVTVMF
jgi:hypothetical protein